MARSIPTLNEGGEHEHVEVLLNDVEHVTFSNSQATFTTPTNPGAYPMTVSPGPMTYACKILEYKVKQVEYKTHQGVQKALQLKIKGAVDNKWLEGITSKLLGFTHKSAKK